MTISFRHASLNSTLKGEVDCFVAHFRGIPYGTIPRRFAAPQPQPTDKWPPTLDCTKYGPRCPQVHVDVRHLLRIPSEHVLPQEPEDEFKCLNLDVTMPADCLSVEGQKLPVLVWIHGGSQAITFGSAASRICDMTSIVQDSKALEKPIIAVSVQYRLNVFAHGDDQRDPKNLAILDQAMAFQWVKTHISGFGGDPDNITLAGESAGAVYCHAHLASAAPVKQVILSSGSLYLSPPQPRAKVTALRENVQKQLAEQTSDVFDLDNAPAALVVEALGNSGIQSWFLEQEPRLEGWHNANSHAQRLLVSEVQFESAIWRNGIWSTDAKSIVQAFDLALDKSLRLKELYGIDGDRPSSCKIGALDFINDYKFALPAEILVQKWRHEQHKAAFRCVIDEPNPWQASNGASHAVDLVLLFGGFYLGFAPAAERTGVEMRRRWISFINGRDPWRIESVAAFGPHGMFQELNVGALRERRRTVHLEYLKTFEMDVLDRVFVELAAGKISLSN